MKVALVSPPWARVDAPSLLCATLKPVLAAAGHEAVVRDLGLELACLLGREDYEALGEDVHLLGDAVFARALGGRRRGFKRLAARLARRYAAREPRPTAASLEALARRAAPRVAELLSGDALAACAAADVVVFACERDVHDQTLPSVALARRLKALNPALVTVLAGASVEGPVAAAVLDAFPDVDWVAQGDPEAVLPGLLSALAGGAPPPPGALKAGGDAASYGLLDGLDGLPRPDFDDWFESLRAARRRGLLVLDVSLPFEGSRGCWWGKKSHCRFCNLNDATIAPRSKSGARLASELAEQARRHHVLRFHARDNILPRDYAADLLPRLAGLDLRVFYEMKPQAGRAEVAALAAAGVREIQSGLETFSSRLLAVAGKGATATQNVAFMKWARRHDVDLRWFLLTGFPGETEADYERVLRVLPRLRHLQPPLRLRRLELTRGSPWFEARGRAPFRDARPYPEYEEVLPSSRLDWSRAAHWFDHELEGEDRFAAARARLAAEVDAWRDAWRRPHPPRLRQRRGEGFLELLDSRAGAGRRDVTTLEGDAAWAYAACAETARSVPELAAAARLAGRALDARALARELALLDDRGLVWEEDGRYLALALPGARVPEEHDILALYRPRVAGATAPEGTR